MERKGEYHLEVVANVFTAQITADLNPLLCMNKLLVYSFIQSFSIFYNNWVSEASPTLGCSIEILRDIYIYMPAVCLPYVKLTA